MASKSLSEMIAFSTKDAELYGLNEAILLAYFDFWVIKNTEGLINEREGKCYTYTSHARLQSMFRFLSKNTIQRTLESLITKGLIEKVYRTGKGIPGGKTMMLTLSDKRQQQLKNR